MLRSIPVHDSVLRATWHVVAIADDIKHDQPLQVNLLGETIALWRAEEKIVAVQDRCPHRGVSLSLGEIESNSRLVCPYHAMAFDSQGKCLRIPADPKITNFPQTAHLCTYPVQEKYGFVWIALDLPKQAIPDFLEWENANANFFHCGPYHINTSAPRIIENFVDVAHFPFTHKGLLGDPDFPEVSDYTLRVKNGEIVASDIHFYQPNPEGTGDAKSVSYVYKIVRPLIAHFRKGEREDQQFSIFMAVTPAEETKSIAWLGVCRNYSPDVSNDELRRFQDDVMAQDIPMVESQLPKKLPLDLQQEFHFPCDKMSLAYRKWLKATGVQFGIC
ncbi:MAG: Rieske 2Fe-2S domain-containing protein [Phormidesmis sp.]